MRSLGGGSVNETSRGALGLIGLRPYSSCLRNEASGMENKVLSADAVSVVVQRPDVVFRFEGTSDVVVRLTPNETREISESLLQKANMAEGRRPETPSSSYPLRNHLKPTYGAKRCAGMRHNPFWSV